MQPAYHEASPVILQRGCGGEGSGSSNGSVAAATGTTATTTTTNTRIVEWRMVQKLWG